MMLGLIEKYFFTAKTFFSYNVLNVNSLECVSMNNQECKIRSEIMLTLISCILLMTHMLNYVFLILLKT